MNYAVRYYNLGRNPFTVTGSMGKKKAGEMSIWTVDDFNKAIANEDNLAKKKSNEWPDNEQSRMFLPAVVAATPHYV